MDGEGAGGQDDRPRAASEASGVQERRHQEAIPARQVNAAGRFQSSHDREVI